MKRFCKHFSEFCLHFVNGTHLRYEQEHEFLFKKGVRRNGFNTMLLTENFNNDDYTT